MSIKALCCALLLLVLRFGHEHVVVARVPRAWLSTASGGMVYPFKVTACKPDSSAKAKEAKQDNTIFKDLDTSILLKTLYDPYTKDSGGFETWKPNYYESLNYCVSADGYCHTRVDTIVYFKNQENIECAAVIFGTYLIHYDDFEHKLAVGGWHFAGALLGIALFQKTESGNWKLYCFSKAFKELGYFGEYKTNRGMNNTPSGTISLIKIGKKTTALSLKQGMGGSTGYFSGYESLYSIDDADFSGFPTEPLKPIFHYNYYECEYIKDSAYTTTRSMKLIPETNDYYKIELSVKENNKSYKTLFHYDRESNGYVEVK